MIGDLRGWLNAAEGSDEEFVDAAWRLCVRRPPETAAREEAVRRLASGELSRAGLLRDLVASPEFARVVRLDDALSLAHAERLRERDVRGPARPRSLDAPPESDERAVEIPWCLARYDGEERVLDVGYAFAEAAWLAGITRLGVDGLTGVDLATADVPGLRSVVADVRDLPFDDGSFELVFCLSTLEHVGRDNETYAVDAPRDDAGDEAALRELRRVLVRDGRLLVSVPTGAEEDQGWQVVRTPEQWIERFERSGFVVFEDELYVHGPDGWHTGTPAAARAQQYGERGPGAGAVLLAELHPGSVGEKVRLAVRDVRHRGDVRRSTVA